MAILFEKKGFDTLQTSWKSSRQQMLVAIEGRHHDQKEKKKKKMVQSAFKGYSLQLENSSLFLSIDAD